MYQRTLFLLATGSITATPAAACSTPTELGTREAVDTPSADSTDCPVPEPAEPAMPEPSEPEAPEPVVPESTVSVEYWLLLAHPSEEAELDQVPDALLPVAERIAQTQGPATFEVLERAGARADETDRAEVDARHASYEHRVDVWDNRMRFTGKIEVHNSRVAPYRPSFETRVTIPLGEPVLLGHGDLSEESGARLFYVVRGTLEP